MLAIANFQKKAVAERREAEPTTGRRNELGLAVGQPTIENYWLRVAASNLASQSPCPSGVTQSHCNPE